MKKYINLYKENSKNIYLYLTFLISLASVLGSLYYSEVEQLDPCNLCWWQRIFMYPLLFITASAIVFKIKKTYIISFFLSLFGLGFAIYHSIIQQIDLEETGFCSPDNPCTEIDVEWFGFFTMPMASALGFATVLIISGLAWFLNKKK